MGADSSADLFPIQYAGNEDLSAEHHSGFIGGISLPGWGHESPDFMENCASAQ